MSRLHCISSHNVHFVSNTSCVSEFSFSYGEEKINNGKSKHKCGGKFKHTYTRFPLYLYLGKQIQVVKKRFEQLYVKTIDLTHYVCVCVVWVCACVCMLAITKFDLFLICTKSYYLSCSVYLSNTNQLEMPIFLTGSVLESKFLVGVPCNNRVHERRARRAGSLDPQHRRPQASVLANGGQVVA